MAKNRQLFLQKATSYIFDWVLNTPLAVTQKKYTMFTVEVLLEIEAQAMTMTKI